MPLVNPVIFPSTGPGAIRIKRTAVANTNYTALPDDYLIEYTSITASRTVTLPDPTTVGTALNPQVFVIKDGTGSVTGVMMITIVATNGVIDGASSKQIFNAYGSHRIYANGTTYYTS